MSSHSGGQPIAGDANGVLPALAAVSEISRSPANLAEVSRLLHARGFRCQRPTPGEGMTCIGRIDGYPKDVILIVPPGYRPTDDAQVVLHLHGHNLAHNGAQYFLDHFQYARAFAKSGRNALFVAPISDNRCDEFEQDLAPSGKFRSFMDGVAAKLAGAGLCRDPSVGSIALTGHSGAYRSLATIIGNGDYPASIHELYLLDSMYGRAPEFAAFASRPGNRIWSVYHPWDSNFHDTEKQMSAELDHEGISYYGPSQNIPTAAQLKANRVGFFYSQYDHDYTDTAYLPMLLRQ